MRTKSWIAVLLYVLLTGSLFRIGALSVCMAGGNVIANDAVVFENTADAGSTEMSSDGDECNIGQKDDQNGTADTCPVSSATSSGTIIDAGGNTSPATPIGGGGVNPGGEIIPGGGIIPTTTYTIILDENWEGGTGRIMENSSSYILPSASRPGETFYGWATTPDGFPIYAAGDTVSPSEDMILYAIWIHYEFFVEDGVLKAYKGTGGDIVIPTGVTAIGDNAFYNCSSLTSITLPAGVTAIGDNAFRICSSLTSITLPAGVTAIGNSAFNGCSSLTSIFIPESVNEIGEYAFKRCPNLTIYAPAGSYARRYAESNGYSFAIQHLSLKGTSVDLSDIINLKLYYAIDDALLESGVYAHIIYADGTDELQEITDELRYTDANGDESYIVNCRMAPKSIGDSISVQLCNESKSENYTSAFVYSVKQYCQDLLAEETCTDEEKTLIQAMLAYGTYSQLYFDYDSSALVIPESEAEISSLEDVCDALTEIPETVSEGTLPEGITFYGSSLVLNSSIAYRMYFVAEDAENAETYGLVKSGTDGLYYIENETVSIAQVGDVLEYTVGDAVIRSCPLLYVKQVVNGAYSEELTNLCIAIYDYYKASVRYAEGQR